jgi:hypothetical protein
MTAEDGIQAAHAFSEATIVPIHFEGWRHLSESREGISRAFEAAGVSGPGALDGTWQSDRRWPLGYSRVKEMGRWHS